MLGAMAKQVTDRQGATSFVASSAETHAPRIQDKFASIYAEYVGATETLPDVGFLAVLLSRRLRAVNARLVEKSDSYDKELTDDAAPRAIRDDATARLTSEVVEIRRTIEAGYGVSMLRELGLDGKTETEPKAILAQAKKLLDALKDPNRVWPKPRRKGVTLNPAAWSEDLAGPIEVLENALSDVHREVREAQAAAEEKSTAMTVNDDTFSRAAGLLSALLRHVEEDTLAAQVRPSGRRPGRVAEADEPVPAGEEGDAGAEPK